MHTLRASTLIHAPIDRCFALSTHLTLVAQTLGMETASTGMVQLDDRVAWRGWKFGLPQRHLSHISAYQRPTYFQDTQQEGRFAFFQHDHWLRETEQGTLLEDEVRFSLPFGAPGRIIARLVLEPHIRRLVRERYALLKSVAESDAWRTYLPTDSRHLTL
ncbi:SRPBCC family protein [Terriglobus tenax]|uniref:SRPBCC family protein n=1 Tax=Terriglobus tenax TaxID=1111115 RepID=UPI0021DF9677|nr:SRPBCC family protein [Terriglobus tenax]